MKTGTALLIGAGVLVAYNFAQLGVAGANIQVIFSGVQVQGPLNYLIKLTVQNVSNIGLRIAALTGAVTINDNQVGNVSGFTPVEVPARGQAVIPLTLNLSLLSLPAAVADIVNNSGGDLQFEVKGAMNVNNLVLPFDVTQQVTV